MNYKNKSDQKINPNAIYELKPKSQKIKNNDKL